ncbi:MAG: type II toxin-antitoxin system death-on-curing family toxin [Actinomycetota bacterium]
MSPVEYLDLDDVLDLVRALGVGPVRDVGLLDSAVNRPRASAFGEDAYTTVQLKAAALLHSIAKNHALVDGNKRTAWLCTVVFCDLNGVEPSLTNDEAYALVVAVASTQMDLPEIAESLQLRPT